MLIEIDGRDIDVEVRCSTCDEVLEINAQYEFGDTLVLEIDVEHDGCESKESS
jgi:hypothetical protein